MLPTLDQMLDMAHAQAARVLVGTNDDLLPVFLFINAEGESGVIAAPFRNAIEKDLCADAARMIFADHQAVAYSFLSEAWLATVRGEEAVKAALAGPPPSERPDRIEVVMAYATTAAESKSKAWRIVRGEGNVCIRLEAMEEDTPSALTGRFTDLLPGQTKH